MKIYISTLLLLGLTIFSCRKNLDNITIIDPGPDQPEIMVIASLTGLVIEEDGEPIPNAMVKIGTTTTTTNEAGVYQFRNIRMNTVGTNVSVYKSGYFPGSDRIYPLLGSHNTNRIILLPNIETGTLAGNEGGTIDIAEGASVILPAGGIIDEGENAYTNDILVSARWLDPTDRYFGEKMPGALQGITMDNKNVLMASMGIIAVELIGPAGEQLQIAPGRVAEVHFPIPSELNTIAPEQIPLWYFDEVLGLWIEEGFATRDGDQYKGEVPHFSFWCINLPYDTETVDVLGCLKFADGSIAANRNVKVFDENGALIAYGSTNDEGKFYGPLPADELLTFSTFDYCEVLHELYIGSVNENTATLDCFELPGDTEDVYTISGQITDCMGVGLDEGVLYVEHVSGGGGLIPTDEMGYFNLFWAACSTESITISGIDMETETISDPHSIILNGEDHDLGEIMVCDDPIEEYLITVVDGYEFFFILFGYNGLYDFGAEGGNENGSYFSGFGLNSLDVGTYTGNSISHFNYTFDRNINVTGDSYKIGCMEEECNDFSIEILLNEGPGGFIEGVFSGTLDGYDQYNQMPLENIPVSGEFRIHAN